MISVADFGCRMYHAKLLILYLHNLCVTNLVWGVLGAAARRAPPLGAPLPWVFEISMQKRIFYPKGKKLREGWIKFIILTGFLIC
jgi:hypothetical protein